MSHVEYFNIQGYFNATNFACDLGIDLAQGTIAGKKLSPQEVSQLRGLLLVRRLEQNGMIDSPLIHPNDCRALHDAYGIAKKGKCKADCGQKAYINPKGETYRCEFLGGRE